RARKLRVGYFAQHQMDVLHADETPIEHLRRERPDESPARLRARLSGFGLMAEQAETLVGRLSGGQKARLTLLLATLDAPHLLILDEPTNHLDMESREALVEALTAYTGAVILVSHDMHLLSLVADRLWLVSGGRVSEYKEDLEAYRRLLLQSDEGDKKAKARAEKRKRPSRDTLLALKAELRKAEERLQKLGEMRDKLATRLADPALYEEGKTGEMEVWQKKYAEVMDAVDRAEDLWLKAQEKLEKAEG
ncbi:MAG TPA: ATP-binding cassette domain-containing protein, partial [Aliiroseovarius sp.]|nr:ATP-binding cassette domain-containing protein [Aliiroseovarius sp.]